MDDVRWDGWRLRPITYDADGYDTDVPLSTVPDLTAKLIRPNSREIPGWTLRGYPEVCTDLGPAIREYLALLARDGSRQPAYTIRRHPNPRAAAAHR